MNAKMNMCCGTPLIFTFIFSGKEWYCRKCKRTYPMFGGGTDVETTKDLVKEHEENRKWFLDIATDCIPAGSIKITGCEKCKAGEAHILHASDEEKKKSEEAYAILSGE